jgi:hypothetical protein
MNLREKYRPTSVRDLVDHDDFVKARSTGRR